MNEVTECEVAELSCGRSHATNTPRRHFWFSAAMNAMTRCRRRRSVFDQIAYSSSEMKRFSGSSEPVVLAYCLRGQLSSSSSTSFLTCLSGIALVRRCRRRRDARRSTTKQYTYVAQTHARTPLYRSVGHCPVRASHLPVVLSLLWLYHICHVVSSLIRLIDRRRLKTTTVISRGRPAAFIIRSH